MDILIKSFNRPYYLDRCIRSVKANIHGDFKITVLDDGTPAKYLNKLTTDYPELTIHTSEASNSKSKLLEDHVINNTEIKIQGIPVTLWKNAVNKLDSDYFMLLEDDVWITSPILIDELVTTMRLDNYILFKLSWGSSPRIITGKIRTRTDALQEIVTKFQVNRLNISVYKLILKNSFKFRSILRRLHLFNSRTFLPLYSLYQVTSSVYSKEYWLHVWTEDIDYVNEELQLYNALTWLEKNPSSRYGKLTNESAKTSFISSATNMFDDVNFNVHAFNYYMNENWFNNRLDPMQNFPKDFDIDYLSHFLDAANDRRCETGEWQRWIQKFKDHFREFGCEIE